MKSEKETLTNLDLTKFLCSMLIIVIHTSPLEQISQTANFFFKDILARAAVPLFFACSGFLLFSKMQWEEGRIKNCSENRTKLFRLLKRVAKLYCVWSFVYVIWNLPGWYRSGWWGIALVKDVMVSFFVRGGHYHLWYLLALLYAVPILYELLRYVKLSRIVYIIGPLWIMECLTYSYSWLGTDRIQLLTMVQQKAPIVFDTLFRAIPLLAVGAFCTVPSKLQKIAKSCILSIVVFAFCVAEASFLYFCTPNERFYSYLIFTPLFAMTFMQLILESEQLHITTRTSSIFRRSSILIYCLHPLIIDICKIKISNNLLIWAITTVATVTIALSVSTVQWKKDNHKKVVL